MTYNLPTSDEIAAVIVGDIAGDDFGRYIVVKQIDGCLIRIHETHPAFIPLQYLLMFPYGDDGYQEDIPYSDTYMARKNIIRTRVTL